MTDNCELINAIKKAARMNSDAISVLQWARDELFLLCEATEDGDLPGGDTPVNRGRRFEAKGIRRAFGEAVRLKIERLSEMNDEISELEARS